MRLATTTGDLERYFASSEECVRGFEGTGFRYLDFCFYNMAYSGSPFMGENWMEDIRRAKKAADELGFTFVQAHSPRNDPFREDWDAVVKANVRAIEACAYLGIPNIVVHSGFIKGCRYPDGKEEYFADNRRFYEALAPAMEQNGVNVLIENSALSNTGGDYFFMTGEEMKDFIRFCGIPRLHACWDVGHANMQNPDQYGDLAALGEDLCAVHIQDNFGKRDDHIAPFMGTLDLDSVMRGLLDSGFVSRGGVFTFECDNILARAGGWPNRRNAFTVADARLSSPSLAIKRSALGLLYQIGREILEAYGLFEG